MAHYLITVYSTTPETACPHGQKHLLEAFIYNRHALRRDDATKRRTASYIAALARNGDTFSIYVWDTADEVARPVPVSFPQCRCRRGYQLDPWSPRYERPDNALF